MLREEANYQFCVGGDTELSYAAFERNSKKFLGFNRKFHRELVDDFLGITTDNEVDGIFHGNTTLLAVEKLVFRNFRCGGFVLYDGVVIVYINVGEGVCSTGGAEEEGVARGIVARSVGFFGHTHQSTIGVLERVLGAR